MTRIAGRWGTIAGLSLLAGACAFEHQRTLNAPTPVDSETGSAPSGAGLTGTWSSEAPLGLPASWRCGNFRWTITSQTHDSLAGSFSALCAGVVQVRGTGSGRQLGNEVHFEIAGAATLQDVLSCPFTLRGTGYIENDDTLRIPYSGDTCLGPVHGEEVLRRPPAGSPAPEPPPDPPTEPPAPAPAGHPNHVGPGPLSEARAEQVVYATGNEFPHLTAPHPTESAAISAAEELLLRIIWHLQLAGYQAARQRNPSGAISNDKLNILIDGAWRTYDVFMDYGTPNQQMRLIFLPISGTNPIAYPGIPD